MASGLSFNGTSSYVSLPITGLPTNTGTLEVRFNPASVSVGSDLVLMTFGSDVANGLQDIRHNATTLKYTNGTVSVTIGTISATTNYLASVSFINNTQLTYLNGVAGGTGTGTNAVSLVKFFIGAYLTGSSGFFNGSIQEVRIWNYPRTPEQVALYSNVTFDPANLPEGLSFYWKADEGTGTSIKDLSDNRNVGTATNCTWVTTAPDLASAGNLNGLRFDGTSNYVEVSNSNIVTGTGSRTLVTKIIPMDVTTEQYFAGYGASASGQEFVLGISGGYFRGNFYGNSLVGTTTAIVGKEYKVALTYDGTTVKLIVNGTQENSATLSITTPSTSVFRFGAMPRSTVGFYTKCALREISLWNTAKTVSEVNAITDNLTGTETGLQGYWKCTEGYGDILHDSSPNNNVGTINGAKWLRETGTNHVYELQFTKTASQYVSVPHSSSLQLDSDFTYIVDYTPYSVSGDCVFISKASSYATANTDYEFQIQNDTTIQINRKGGYLNLTVPTHIMGQRYRYIIRQSGTTVTIWRNGVLQATGTITNGSKTAGTDAVVIGAYYTTGGFIDGRMGDHKLYSRALTDSECKAYSNDLPISTTGLVLDLPCNEGYGYGTVRDRSTYGNDGAISGAQWVLKDRQGMKFDGTDDWIQIPTGNLPTNTCTLEIKFMPNSVTGNRTLLYMGSDSASQRHIIYGNATSLVYNQYVTDLTIGTLAIGNIYLASIVINGNTQLGYFNGVYVTSTSSTNSLVYGNCYIGKNQSSNAFASGGILEVRIWNTVRTPAEIALYKDLEVNSNTEGLVFLWRGRCTPDMKYALDETPNANHGIISGCTISKEQAATAKIKEQRSVIL